MNIEERDISLIETIKKIIILEEKGNISEKIKSLETIKICLEIFIEDHYNDMIKSLKRKRRRDEQKTKTS